MNLLKKALQHAEFLLITFCAVSCGTPIQNTRGNVEQNVSSQEQVPFVMPVYQRETPEEPTLDFKSTDGVYDFQFSECEGQTATQSSSQISMELKSGLGQVEVLANNQTSLTQFSYLFEHDLFSASLIKQTCSDESINGNLMLPGPRGELLKNCALDISNATLSGQFQLSGNSLIRRFKDPIWGSVCRWVFLRNQDQKNQGK